MSYTAYIDEKVFQDNSLNVAVNLLYTNLTGSRDYSVTDLALSGNAALMVQGDITVGDVRVIPYITSNAVLFKELSESLRTIWRTAQVVRFKDRIQVTMLGVFFEFWLSAVSVKTVTIEDLILQDADTIPNFLK